MNALSAWIIGLFSLGGALFAAWHTVRSYRFSNPLFWVVALVEVALLLALIVGAVLVATTDHQTDAVLFLSYLATAVFLLPLALWWGIGDETRWGTAVVAVAFITVAVLVLRVHQIWEGGAHVG